MFGQALVQPCLYALACILHDDTQSEWWYGALGQHWAVQEWLAYTLAYFLQDTVLHFALSSNVLLLHHAASALACVLLCAVDEWLGVMLSCAEVMELGSLMLQFSDIGLAPRRLGPVVCIASSVVPILWVLSGYFAAAPASGTIWFVSVGVLIVGIVRSQEAYRHL